MYDRGLSVLEQYGLEAKSTYRGRGALVCDTEAGLVLIKEFCGTQRKLVCQAELLDKVQKAGEMKVDCLLPNLEGAYVSADKDNCNYVVKRWYEGKECDTQSLADIRHSVAALASLHKVMKMPVQIHYVKEPLNLEFERRNRELRKIRKFICQKNRKNNFELRYMDSISCFLYHGEEALRRLCCSGYKLLREDTMQEGSICHGEFNQHNVLLPRDGACVTNFDKWNYDVQTGDLYQFMRKILEKNNWDQKLGKEMLNAYQEVRPLSVAELENMKIRFSYPEKYWKLANYYYTRRKVWISEKSQEKLDKLIEQHDKWMDFVENILE